jgi:hypothetical protein
VDEPEGEFPFVRHFHFVWVLSGPLTISLESLEAAAQARVVVAWAPQIYFSVGCSAPHIKQLTVDLVILRSPLGVVESTSSGFGPSDPVSTSKVDGVVASRMLRLLSLANVRYESKYLYLIHMLAATQPIHRRRTSRPPQMTPR